MKKIVFLQICTAVSLLLASCGGSAGEPASPTPQDAGLSVPATTSTTAAETLPTSTFAPLPTPTYPWVGEGRIAFYVRENESDTDIYMMDSDGGNRTKLTTSPAFDLDPTWSPDGQTIAFATDRDGNYEIYLIDADGGNLVNLTHSEGTETSPAWSPDGEHIAFTYSHDWNADIYIMDADGGNRVNLTQTTALETDPAWSPDGQRMAFASDRSGSYQIYVMDISSGNTIQVSNIEDNNYDPAWSPDGQRIAFYSERFSVPGRIREIYLVDADGENLVQLTNHYNSSRYPAWSPDGQWIAFRYYDYEEDHSEIRVINIDSQREYTLGGEGGGGSGLAWSWNTMPTDAEVDLQARLAGMIRVPAGNFYIGGSPTEALVLCQTFRDQCQIEWFYDEAPVHLLEMDEYYIDQYEVTNADYARCVNAGACAPPDRTSSATRASYYGNPEYNDYPVIYVSWEDAVIYCAWRDARLPTEAEWEAAARGGVLGNPFPWGSELPVCESGPMWGAQFDDGDLCAGADTSPVGSFSPNPLGIYDMSGNVIEWTADWYDVYPGGDPSISNDFGEIYRVARGGSWYTYGDALRVAIRLPAAPTASFNHYGFRCAASP